MPSKSANVKNEKQYEALKDKGMRSARPGSRTPRTPPSTAARRPARAGTPSRAGRRRRKRPPAARAARRRPRRAEPSAAGRLRVAERLGQLGPAHLGATGQVFALGDVVELLAGLGRGAAGALALGHGRALLAEGTAGLGRHVGDRALLLRPRLGLLDVPLGGGDLLLRRHSRPPWRPAACRRFPCPPGSRPHTDGLSASPTWRFAWTRSRPSCSSSGWPTGAWTPCSGCPGTASTGSWRGCAATRTRCGSCSSTTRRRPRSWPPATPRRPARSGSVWPPPAPAASI